MKTNANGLSTPSVIRAIAFGLAAAGLLHAAMLGSASTSAFVKAHSVNAVSRVCDLVGLNNCERLSAKQYDPLVKKLGDTKSFEDAMSLMSWSGGSERETVRYLGLVRAMQNETWPNRQGEKPWEVARDALLPSWYLFPKLTVGSQCYWCSYHDSNMYEWFTNSRYHDDYLESLVEYTPHLFGQFDWIIKDKPRKHAMAVRQSMLANHGNRYGYLGKMLFEKQDWSALRVLVANTSSAAPIMGLDWQKIPDDIVELSWQQGVRVSDDLPIFTEKLIQAGYRPALRWALWVVAEGRSNNKLRRLSGYVNSYQALLDGYTDFKLRETESHIEAYNQRWRDIVFDASTRKWIYRPS